MRLTLFLLATMLWGCAPEPTPPNAPPATPPEPAPQSAPAPTRDMTGPAAVSDAWVRSVPPAARMTAGYLSIHNPGPDALVIVGVESPMFAAIEMHSSDVVDGVSRMRQQQTVRVPAGETVRFEPGGLHLMLMQPADAIPSSGEIEMALVLESGERLPFVAPVGQPGS